MSNIIAVDPKTFGLEETKAADIAKQFKPMLDKMVELEAEYNTVISLPIETAAPQAKALRLKYVKVRTGTEKIHKDQKAFYLSAGRFVDGWKNAQLFASDGIEKKLEEIENYAANKEKERIALLQSEREALLSPYGVENLSTLQLGTMAETVWGNFLAGTKQGYENKIEAERIVEEKRLADIEAEKQRIEAQRIENERLKKEAEETARLRAEEQAKAEAELKLQREKAEQERKRLEDIARIEREAAEKKLQAERAEAAKQAKIQAAKLAEELEKANKLAEELQAKKDAEEAELNRLAQIEADKIKAEQEAAKAPVKEKLRVAIESLSLTLPESDITNELMAKFNGFKTWATAQINNL